MRSLLFAWIFLPVSFFSQDLEVFLPTRVELNPVYLTKLHVPAAEHDWRYFEELRAVLAFDFNHNGLSTLIPTREDLEEELHWPDVKTRFDLNLWKKEQIPWVLAIQICQNHFELTAFNIEKGASKKYPNFLLSGKLDVDRREIHRLADAVQKDLFGMEGIASLRILFTKRTQHEQNRWNSEVWVCDSDGANAERVLSDEGYCLSPGFFPRALLTPSDFYYVSYQQGQSKIFRSSFKTAKKEPLITLRGSQALPSMNQKGDLVAFISDTAGRPDLFLQTLDSKGFPVGKARQIFSAPRATQASSTFSPDGKKIAFVSDKDGSPRIYLLDIEGAKALKKQTPRLLTKKNRQNTSPAWSPDGTKLAYSAKSEGERQIWIYDFSTEEEIQLTSGPENKENPSWAPDSSQLLYNTESNESCEIYRIDLCRKEPVLLPNSSGQNRFPCFEPSASTEKFLRAGLT